MFSYQPPLRDMQFVLNDVLRAPQALSELPAFSEVDTDLMQQVAEEAGRFAKEVLFPTNSVGDAQGCRLTDQGVVTPDGFRDAYQQFVAGGWPALACDPAYGGQGLPHTLNVILYEMLCSTNQAWTMFPGLLQGAYECLHQHASQELKDRYLHRIVSGEWLATMCLTESHAGSDLGLLRTKAVPQEDGSVRITGNKIFISGGDSDLTENIVHLVLARLPDAPPGSKGISLFLVPKFLPDGSNELAKQNSVRCIGLEHKMGIHGSPTCSMEFDDAIGWLVGEPHKGLAAMFVMMNSARLHVGIQGLGIAEAAYQNALTYAQERPQMRAAVRPASRKNEPADPIIMHPPVQRLLMTQRAYVEGCRMMALYCGLLLDEAAHHPDAERRLRAEDRLALLTPVVKALMTDQGFEGSSMALQVYGGHGYVRETGIEQYVRDSRIAMIYEGTNEIQAVDLLLRKILGDGGSRLQDFFGDIKQTITDQTGGQMDDCAQRLARLIVDTAEVLNDIGRLASSDPSLPFMLAPDVLRLLGHCALAWLWLQAGAVAGANDFGDLRFYQTKVHTARYYFDFVLPEADQRLSILRSGVQNSQDGRSLPLLSDVMENYDR